MHAGRKLIVDQPPQLHSPSVSNPFGWVLSIASIGLAMLLVGFALWRYTGLPTVYLYPNGGCAVVVDADDEPHDCGWEEGRVYHVEYVSWRTDLSQLYGEGRARRQGRR